MGVDRKKLVEDTERAMRWYYVACSSCNGIGWKLVLAGGPEPESRRCGTCGGRKRIPVLRKNISNGKLKYD